MRLKRRLERSSVIAQAEPVGPLWGPGRALKVSKISAVLGRGCVERLLGKGGGPGVRQGPVEIIIAVHNLGDAAAFGTRQPGADKGVYIIDVTAHDERPRGDEKADYWFARLFYLIDELDRACVTGHDLPIL